MAQLTNNTGADLLFSQYIDVVNRSISENRDEFYGKVVKLWETAFGTELIEVGVYDQEADEPYAWYTIRLRGGRFELVSNRKDPAAKWTMKLKDSYLQKIVSDADYYVEHPFKLELERLKARIGIC